ncbi:uncharacterized protein LOC144769407 [Lissotriton helveticus]
MAFQQAMVSPQFSQASEKHMLMLVSWNITGLKSKTSIVEWSDLVEEHDIWIFQETWAVDPIHRPGVVQYFTAFPTDAPYLGGIKILLLMFADDTLILSKTQKGLQAALNKFEEFCHDNDLQVNVAKTKVMILSKTRPVFGHVTMNNIQLEQTNVMTYLGFVLENEIESWSRELEKQTPQTKPLDLYKLRVEIEELMAGNVGLDRLNTYSEEELSFICKSFTRNTRVLHEKLSETAVSMGVDISKSKPLQKPYRADFSDKDIEHLNVAGKKLQIKELMGVLQKWGDVERWRSRWAKKREEVRSRQVTPEFTLREVEKPEQLCPMREVPGGKYVHVPWSRQDIVSFTNDFPKLREKPVDWYRQVERFVKVQKCLWKDLDGFFDIVVPVDLWTQCKIAIDWPSEEYPRNKETGEPSKDVMRKYEQVIQHLKEKVPAKETDWTKIDRTTQERDETVHSFYERLLQVFKTYSGIDNIDLKDMTHFIYRFVNGLRPEICQWIKDNTICWHTKKMDEVLRYAKYCEDEMAEKKKALKEKVMWAQVKLAEQQEKQLRSFRNVPMLGESLRYMKEPATADDISTVTTAASSKRSNMVVSSLISSH